MVDLRHEASAGFAAEAAARVSGTIGAAAVCPGPGFTNVLTSLTNARADRTPVLYLVSSNPDGTQESNGLQVGLDHVAVASPIAKWAAKVATPLHLARLVAQAIRIATTAPCGPVLLDVPADILGGPAVDGSRHYAVHVDAARVANADVDRCLNLLVAAARPAVLVGHTASARARAALATFATQSGVPCFLDYRAVGALADDHPAYGGTLYQLARLPSDARPDVVLAVGVQFGFDTPGLRDGGVAWGAVIIHVETDPAEVGRFSTGPADLVADPDQMLVGMASRATSTEWHVAAEWNAVVQNARSDTRAKLDAISAADGERVHPYAASRIVSDAVATSGAILIGDGAVCKHWLHDALRLPAGAVYLTHGRFGCMGTGLGLAIGSAVTMPARPVLCVTGDGALGFTIGEFEAMVRHQLPITIVVLNNARWGASQGFQMRPGSRQRVVGTDLSDADYHNVMIAFGGQGSRVDSVDELASALAAALASGQPTCINVSTSNLGVAPEIPFLNA